MRQPVSYLVDRIFPTKEIHIIAGASGVGKTTWAFQMLDDWRKSAPVLGYNSFPCPWVYVSCDRSKQSVATTLERVGVMGIPLLDARGVSEHEAEAFDVVLRGARQVNPDVRFIFVEAFSLLVPQVSFKDSYRVTAQFLSKLVRTLEKEDLTIIGTAHSPKQRENDQITDPRQMVLGTVAWGAFVETIIAIRRMAPKDPSNQNRQILLLPRNAREQAFEYTLDDNGRFITAELTKPEDVMVSVLDGLPFDKDLQTADLKALAKGAGMHERAAERWIREAVVNGLLEDVSWGKYRRKGQH